MVRRPGFESFSEELVPLSSSFTPVVLIHGRARAVLLDNVVPSSPAPSSVSGSARAVSAISGTLASLVWAFFPKCPLCWAAYLSVFGITGAQQILYFSKMRPVFLALMLINAA